MSTNDPGSGQSLYIVDGHSHLYKAFYAIRGLSTADGKPTNAVYGFVQILHRMLESRQPDYLAVVFDAPGPSFRSEIYKDYKANRPAAPEDLSAQIPWLHKVLEAMRIRVIVIEGVEADDVIATLSDRGRARDLDVWIVTSDKDLYQLVGPGVRVLRLEPNREIDIDAEEVRKRMGVGPEQIPDLLGLMGDSSDNIPGVPGVGQKTAAKLLEDFPGIEALYDNLESVSSKRFRNLLGGNREQALLSKRLAVLRRDLDLSLAIEDLRRNEPDREALRALYERLEFKNLLQRLGPGVQGAGAEGADAPAATKPPPEVEYEAIGDEAALREYLAEVRPGEYLSIDTETTEIDPMRADLVGISLSVKPGKAVYVPVGHQLLGAAQPALEQVREVLGPVLEDAGVPKTGQNLKYDLKILIRHGFEINGVAFDTLLASYLLDPDRASHGLKSLGKDRLGIQMTEIEELIGRGKKQGSMADVEIERAMPYACADADVALQLTHLLESELQEQGLKDLLDEMEIPLMTILNRMEMTGVRIDPAHFKRLSGEIASRMDEVARTIFELAGRSFNIGSPKQVGEILFDEIGLKPIRQTKTGPSTDVGVLEQLSASHPLPKEILKYRMLGKLKSTYVDVLPQMVNRKTGRIHTHYNQAIAATGRLSSSDPNLQNIPVRTREGRQIRAGFIPLEDGHLLLAADYSQIELRVLAHVTGDPALVEAFRSGEDIHRATAARVFGCSPEEVTSEMRGAAKVVNFGIIYGMSAHRLAGQLEIPRGRAAQFIDDYFAAYPGVKKWTEKIVGIARESGYVTTLSGRRRAIANIRSRNHNVRRAAERVAVNTPIQGTAADMIKRAMIAIDRRLRKADCGARMIMQVHDELILDVPAGEVDAVSRAVVEEMENAMPLDVPVQVDVKTGRNWEEC